MAQVILVSNFWPSIAKTGVALTASRHANLLLKAGHHVSIVGSDSRINDQTQAVDKYYIFAKGGGSLYAPARVNKGKIYDMLAGVKADLLIIEGWQTAITDGFIDAAYKLNIRTILISHGCSLHPFSFYPLEVLRSLGWIFYKKFLLPSRLKKLHLITCLDDVSISSRFYDRDLARHLRLNIKLLPNTPINFSKVFSNRESRELVIVLVGYFSRIKNQLAAIRLMKNLPTELSLHLIGRKNGYYYVRCKQLVNKLKLENRVKFISDSECVLEGEIGGALLVLSTSITEVQPLVILEAMASGTPYVATPVGGIISLHGGILAENHNKQVKAILSIYQDQLLWEKLALEGREMIDSIFSDEVTAEMFNHIVNSALLRCENND